MQDAPLVLATGAFTLMAGLAMIAGHHHWSGAAAIVISLIGIAATLKGASLMIAPDLGTEMTAAVVHTPAVLPFAAGVEGAAGSLTEESRRTFQYTSLIRRCQRDQPSAQTCAQRRRQSDRRPRWCHRRPTINRALPKRSAPILSFGWRVPITMTSLLVSHLPSMTRCSRSSPRSLTRLATATKTNSCCCLVIATGLFILPRRRTKAG